MPHDPHFRRTARQPIELRVSYRRDAGGAPLERAGRLVDLGMGGAQIESPRPPPASARLRILLTSPSAWDPLDLPAEVRWVDRERSIFGVEFGALSPSQATALYELLQVSQFRETES